MTDEHHSDECEDEVSSPQEMPKETAVKAIRDPVTGQFLKGTAAGPGRPKGSKDKLNVQVIEALEKLWASRGAEIIDQLAAEKPEVVASLIARLIPQELATQAITGEDEAGKAQSNQEVTVRVVTQQHQDVLPPREVDGELLIGEDNTTH